MLKGQRCRSKYIEGLSSTSEHNFKAKGQMSYYKTKKSMPRYLKIHKDLVTTASSKSEKIVQEKTCRWHISFTIHSLSPASLCNSTFLEKMVHCNSVGVRQGR